MSWWQRLTGQGPADADEPARWVVLDVETSGLDPHRDRLLAIAAIGLRVDWATRRLDLRLGDSFEIVLRQDEVATSRENILLHGIGVQSQRDGVAPAVALRAFLDWIGSAPLLAFHSGFDETLIKRHVKQHLRLDLPNPWVDIEHLCAVTHERVLARSLDEWMAHFGITCARRHEAAADTLAECELLLRVWPRVAAQSRRWRDVQRLADQRRWLGAR